MPGKESSTDLPLQSAALGYVETGGSLAYVLVTSRRTRRWIFPKGSVAPGESAPAAAARELAEEAGAIGEARAEPIGCYDVLKMTDKGLIKLRVALYPVRIASILEKWPEKGVRTRRLAGAAEAASLLASPDMVELLAAFERLHRQGAA